MNGAPNERPPCVTDILLACCLITILWLAIGDSVGEAIKMVLR